MAGLTNKGKAAILEAYFRNTGAPTNFYIALITSAVAPTEDTNLMSELTEIAEGNDYVSGGYMLNRNATDFDVLNEDDTEDRGSIQIKDVAWIANGGNIPASGDGARYSVLTDDNVVVADREVCGYFSLGSDRTVSDGQALTLQDMELQLNEPI